MNSFTFKNYTIDYYNVVNDIELFMLPIEPNIACINLSIIPESQQDTISTYHQCLDRHKRLLSRSFLLEYCQAHYGLTEFEFMVTPYHQPLLKSGAIHFSLSYATHYVALALSPSRRLGVDIAFQDNTFNIEGNMPSLVMSAEELTRFQSLPNVYAKRRFFYQLWTAKESLLKAWGVGLLYEDITTLDVMTSHNNFFHYKGCTYEYQPVTCLDEYAMGLSFAVR